MSAELDTATRDAIEAGLDGFNQAAIGLDRTEIFWVVCRDRKGGLVGGARCLCMWQWLVVDWLWIAHGHRGAGIGAAVLQRAELAAVTRGCTEAMLNSFSFQAPGFYRRQGYAVFGQLDDMPPGHARYWMRKSLPGHRTEATDNTSRPRNAAPR